MWIQMKAKHIEILVLKIMKTDNPTTVLLYLIKQEHFDKLAKMSL